MEKNYFKPAGDLPVDEKISSNYFETAGDLPVDEKIGNKYFETAGDLPVDEKMGNKYFETAGDLPVDEEKGNNYFKPAGDLPSNEGLEVSINEINNYLLTVVSGERFDYECELGTLCGAGQTIVSFEELKTMVSEGYNIVKAECINPKMIVVEFQKYKKDNINNFRR